MLALPCSASFYFSVIWLSIDIEVKDGYSSSGPVSVRFTGTFRVSWSLKTHEAVPGMRNLSAFAAWFDSGGNSDRFERAALAQPLPAAASQPAFEVASIKSSTDRQHGNVTEIAPGGERFTATNASLKLLLMTAYGVNDRQISGGPSWLNSEFYDIQAKAERPSSPEQVRLMLQWLRTRFPHTTG
jgi:hypothetical protein